MAKTTKSNEPKITAEMRDFMENEWARIQWETKAIADFEAKTNPKPKAKPGFRSALADFVQRAKAGEEELINAKVAIDLNTPMEGTSAKYYQGAGWSNVNLTDIEFVDGEGITFYPYGLERANPMVYLPWSSISSIILR